MVYVYRNLHKDCWSVLEKGLLKQHRRRLTLQDVEFRVRPAGQKRALEEGRKNVHAFAIGKEVRNYMSRGRGVAVRYDIKRGKFVNNRGRHVLGAGLVLLFPEGSVWAFKPRYA